MRPIPGTITDPAMDRVIDGDGSGPSYPSDQRFLIIDDLATVYGEFLTRSAADDECRALVQQGVECWVMPVTRVDL